MSLNEFINRLDSIIRGSNVNEWNINVKDNLGDCEIVSIHKEEKEIIIKIK